MSQTQTTRIRLAEGRRHHSNTGRILRRMLRQPATIAAAAFIVLLFVTAIFAPMIAPYPPTEVHFDNVLEPPSAQFLLGTDDLGRDQLSRLIYGAQVVLIVALGAVVIAALIGVPIGLLLGFNGGWWDRVGMRFVDMAQALPGMLIGLTVVAILGRNIIILMFAIGLIGASMFARMTRAVVLVERSKLYVEAGEVAGLSRLQLVFGQILPNLVGPIVTQASVFLGSAIMIESAMSFLGVGLDSEVPTWGAMLSLALDNQASAPYLTWPPGIAIVLTVLSFSVFGDGLNDALTGERRRLPRLGLRAPGSDAEASLPVPPNAARVARAQTTDAGSDVAPAPDAAENVPAALTTRDVTVALARPDGSSVDIVKHVSLDVAKGEIVGLLGESGSGKSTFARSVLGMLPPGTWLSSGSIRLQGEEIAHRRERDLRHIRGTRMGAVFQDPMSALSPVHTVGMQLTEPLRIHKGMNRKQARSRAVELLERVGVRDAASRLDDYPHQFSGGMAQRVAIAMALAADPALLIADEATSALDVTTQAQVLDLILDLRQEYGMGVLMITHSLGVVAETCDRVAVMYNGRIVEDAPVAQLFAHPQHPYTRALLGANPLGAARGGRLPTIDADLRAQIDAAMDDVQAGVVRR